MRDIQPTAALFDLDGTLVDSLQDIAASMNEVLERRGFPVHPVDAYRIFVGDGMDLLARRCLPSDVDPASALISDMVQEMKRTYHKHWKNHVKPYEGIRDLLSQLHLKGIRLGILSNKPEAFTIKMVQYVFPDVAFATVRGAREGLPIKPAPDGAVDILQEWDLTPEQVLYVGDTNTDIATGKNTGMPTVGVTWGFRDREELEDCGADWVVDKPSEIRSLFA